MYGSADVFEEVLRESVQSSHDCGGRSLNERVGLFADAGSSSLKTVEQLATAAHKLLLFFVSDSLREHLGAYKYNGRT